MISPNQVAEHQRAQRDREHEGLRHQHHPPAVEAVGNGAAHQREQHDRQRGRGLHQRHHVDGVGDRGHQPGGADALDQAAEARGKVGDPDGAEGRVPKRSQGRRAVVQGDSLGDSMRLRLRRCRSTHRLATRLRQAKGGAAVNRSRCAARPAGTAPRHRRRSGKWRGSHRRRSAAAPCGWWRRMPCFLDPPRQGKAMGGDRHDGGVGVRAGRRLEGPFGRLLELARGAHAPWPARRACRTAADRTGSVAASGPPRRSRGLRIAGLRLHEGERVVAEREVRAEVDCPRQLASDSPVASPQPQRPAHGPVGGGVVIVDEQALAGRLEGPVASRCRDLPSAGRRSANA